MMGQRVRLVVGSSMRSISCDSGEKREFRQPSEQPLNDPSYLWVEHSLSKALKTWRDVEEEYACTQLARSNLKNPPERKMFRFEAGDLYICKRGCLQTCILPPCYDEYLSSSELIMYRLTRLAALAVFLGLVYSTYKFHIWGPTVSTLDSVLGAADDTVSDLGSVGATILGKYWNAGVALMFSGVRWVFPPNEREPEIDELVFINLIQEDIQDRKDKAEAALLKEDPNIFEDWELVYNYVKPPPKLSVEVVDDADWLWMEHRDPNYVKPCKPNLPFEKGAKLLSRQIDRDHVTLASVYTDLCGEWAIAKGGGEGCPPVDDVCTRKLNRKKRVRIKPSDCEKCPYRPEKDE